MNATAEQPVVLVVLGTRPEAIKLIPVIRELKKHNVPYFLCNTGQHRGLLDSLLTDAGIKANIDFQLMKHGQTLSSITAQILTHLATLFATLSCALVIVQGDTTTAFATGLSAFYHKIPVAHIEAGLRSGDKSNPFPEEVNRCLLASLARYHFAPTAGAAANLIRENVPQDQIFVTGNTVVDALRQVKEYIQTTGFTCINPDLVELFQREEKDSFFTVLLTVHRRESVTGPSLGQIFSAVHNLLSAPPSGKIQIVYPMHPNPRIKQCFETFSWTGLNMHVIPPLAYRNMVYALDNSDLVVTDSGGLVEEASSLNKPTLVVREVLDRPEALLNPQVKLIGVQTAGVEAHLRNAWKTRAAGHARDVANPFGDGYAARKIVDIIQTSIPSVAAGAVENSEK